MSNFKNMKPFSDAEAQAYREGYKRSKQKFLKASGKDKLTRPEYLRANYDGLVAVAKMRGGIEIPKWDPSKHQRKVKAGPGIGTAEHMAKALGEIDTSNTSTRNLGIFRFVTNHQQFGLTEDEAKTAVGQYLGVSARVVTTGINQGEDIDALVAMS